MARATGSDTPVRTARALGTLVERITPWLLELGAWIFGALIAFDILILSALLTVGPIDSAVLIATAAVALALPPAIAGLLLLRLAAEMKRVDVEQVATQALVESGFTVHDLEPKQSPATLEQHRARAVLRFSYSLMALTVALSFIGVTAALWYMAWWIGAAFAVMAVMSLLVFLLAVSSSGARRTWTTPAGETDAKPK
jgi:hypothetical protein